ncbi:MAG: MarR family winged helix-turn-helix transcriptional regulator [Ilumatobacteraceae bacterium]
MDASSDPSNEDRDSPRQFDDDDYASLLEFRDGLRQFLRWSQDSARAAGLTPSHHQLLLAIRGHRGPVSIGDVAEHLMLKHHSAVELVDRAAARDLVERVTDDDDQRVVRVRLTAGGERRLQALASAHLEELSRTGPRLAALWNRLPQVGGDA